MLRKLKNLVHHGVTDKSNPAAKSDSARDKSSQQTEDGLIERAGPHIWPEEEAEFAQEGNTASTGTASVDIVFLHGLRGDPIRTWSTKVDGDERESGGSTLCWPRDLLKKDMPAARVISWGYDADVANLLSQASQASIFGNAQTLLEDLARVRRKEKTRPIIWVGHSLGGLVIKAAIILAAGYKKHERFAHLADLYPATIGVIFLGTPHRGSDAEKLGHVVAAAASITLRRPNKQLLGSLATNSHILEKQRDDFVTVSRDLEVVCCYEEKPMSVGLIVPQASAVYDGFKVQSLGIPADHSQMVKFSVDSIGYQRVVGHLQRLLETHQESINKQDSANSERFYEEIKRDLYFPTMDEREERIKEAFPGTLAWSLDDHDSAGPQDNGGTTLHAPEFASWLSKPDQPIFWISGKAGSGKSTLMKWIYRQPRTAEILVSWAQDRTLLTCHFFMFERGTDPLQKSREGMLRSVLFQLIDNHKELAFVAFPVTPSLGKSKMKTILPLTWTALRDAFIRVLEYVVSNDWRLCMFIDGLDEYRNETSTDYENAEYLDALDDAKEQSTTGSASVPISAVLREIASLFESLKTHHKQVKMCLSSRELAVFEETFKNCPRLRVQEYTRYDIQRSTSEILSRMDLASSDHQYLVDQIVQKSRGVFLWVRLVIDLILDGHESGDDVIELRAAIDTMPTMLLGREGLYMRMMKLVRREHLFEGSRIFRLVRDARNPLDAEMLSYALRCLPNGDNNFEPAFRMKISLDGLRDLSKTGEPMKRKLKSRCGGLLECEPPFYQVDFMHQTAKEFVSRDSTWIEIFKNEEREFEVELTLFAACVMKIKAIGRSLVEWTESSRNQNSPERLGLSYIFVADAMYYAQKVDTGTSHHAMYFSLVDELDRTANEIAASSRPYTYEEAYDRPHWPSFEPMESGRQFRYENFLTYAAKAGLSVYLEAKLNQISDRAAILRSILEDISCLHGSGIPMLVFSGNNYYQIGYHFARPEVTEVLLRLGADPEEAWRILLMQGRKSFRTTKRGHTMHSSGGTDPLEEEFQCWINMVRLFLRYVVDPYRIIEIEGSVGRKRSRRTVTMRCEVRGVLQDIIAYWPEYKEALSDILAALPEQSDKQREEALRRIGDQEDEDWNLTRSSRYI